MDFLLTKYSVEQKIDIAKYYQFKINDYSLFVGKHYCETIKSQDNSTVFLLGDCINLNQLLNYNSISASLIKKLKGVFILIAVKDDSVKIFSSIFGILPIYYSANYNTISNSLELIKTIEDLPSKINKRFILESYLFNYPFSNQTYLDGIKRLDSFSGIEIKNGEINIENIFDVTEWFAKEPVNGKKELKNLGKSFLDNIKQYYAPSRNSVTFTSGFDGRSIVSAGLKFNASFSTFSMGRPENDDVYNPLSNSKDLGISYHYYDLGGTEYLKESFEMSKRISKITGGFNGFLYPHFLYGAVKEKTNNDFLLTGYCGSELFRALHIHGAVTSRELVNIFSEPNDAILKQLLWDSPKLSFIIKSEFEKEFEDLFDEIIAFRKIKDDKQMSENHFFYHYIFTEVFRKVFGSWTVAQFQEIKVRIPFLDFDFITELMKTNIAGCNNEFFTHNPFKRIKGQILYSEILRQSSEKLYNLYTGKGYRPCDLSTFCGKTRILLPYLKKKIRKKATKVFLDNLGLISSYKMHQSEIEKTFHKLEGFNLNKLFEESKNLHDYINEPLRDMIFQAASIASII